ncbi:MAG: hypothetical protein E7282_06740 [Lachnospiraceae bacterium]|nr:hypothetical protein [Lachnospiraceae bacterium]
MSWVENVLIVAGISLDLFANMECQGSLVAKVNKKHLTLICLIVGMWQLAALFIGYFFANLLLTKQKITDDFFVGELIAIIIFLGLGCRLIVKAIKNERIQEHLETKLGYKRFVQMASLTSMYTVLAGIAFAFFGTDMFMVLIMILGFSIIFVVSGMYVGYHYGFEGKGKAYAVGTILLWAAGVDLIVRMVLQYAK